MTLYLYTLLALFLVVTPLSISTIGDPLVWKIIRVAITVLIGVGSCFCLTGIGRSTKAFLSVLGFLALASLWSEDALAGLSFKALTIGLFLGGVAYGLRMDTQENAELLVKIILVSALVLAGILWRVAWLDGESIWRQGRLSLGGINPNYYGLFSGVYSIIAAVGLGMKVKFVWRFLALAILVGCIWLAFASGSRAGILIVAISCLVLMLQTLLAMGFRVVAASFFLGLSLGMLLLYWLYFEAKVNPDLTTYGVAEYKESRLERDLLKDTRSKIWSSGVEEWLKSPIVGVGWYGRNGRWFSAHSAYLQVLIETGVIGGVFVLRALWITLSRSISNLRFYGSSALGHNNLNLLCVVLTLGLLLHGVGESALVQGSTPLPVLLGIGVAQVDLLFDKRAQIDYNELSDEDSLSLDVSSWDHAG